MNVSQVPIIKSKVYDYLAQADEVADIVANGGLLYGLRAESPAEYIALADVNEWDHEYATLGPEAAIDETFGLRLVVWTRIIGSEGTEQQEATERCFEMFEATRGLLRAPTFIADSGLESVLVSILVKPTRFREIPYLDGQAAYVDAMLDCQTRI